ncbi:hypothetical protein B0H12DRAFT_589661 [Mycena haematopus]|nr:hypothetical protein B0H12DRAFT_589661 [Mycena haematopus]
MLFALAEVSLDVACAAMFLKAAQIFEDGGSPEADVSPYQAYVHMFLAREVLTTINNMVADCVLLYRCVTIWGPSPYKRVVTTVPLLLILSTAGVGLWGTFAVKSATAIPFAVALFTNFVLFSLTAGRVWSKRRQITVILGAEAGKPYSMTLQILCESSLLYFVNMLAFLIASIVVPRSVSSAHCRTCMPDIMPGPGEHIMGCTRTGGQYRADDDHGARRHSKTHKPGQILRRQSKQRVRDGPDFKHHYTSG